MTTTHETVYTVIGSFVLTALTYVAGLYFGWIPIDAFSWLEFGGVALNYACVFLYARQRIAAWPLAIVAVILLGILFWQLNLLASLALHIGYFLPISIWGWYQWRTRPDGTQMQISWMDDFQRGVAASAIIPIYVVVVLTNLYFGGILPFADTAILVFSVLAQFLLNFKKADNWILWIIVNLIAIYTYFSAGAFLLGLQYVLFLFNAIYGLYKWTAGTLKVES